MISTVFAHTPFLPHRYDYLQQGLSLLQITVVFPNSDIAFGIGDLVLMKKRSFFNNASCSSKADAHLSNIGAFFSSVGHFML